MAQQFDIARVTFQPSQPASTIPVDVFDKQSAALSGLAQQELSSSSAAFDQAIASYNDIAVENAQKDAAGLVKRNGDGELIAPSSFYPGGIHSPAYTKAFRQAAQGFYRESATSDFQAYVEGQKALFPTNPEAFRASVDKKRQAMLETLSDDQKGFMDLRFQQITGQASTQVSVNRQAAVNKTNLELADLGFSRLVDDAVRSHSVWSGPEQGKAGEEGIKAISNAVTNQAIFAERWKDQEAMWLRAGLTPEQIAKQKTELGYAVTLKILSEEIKNTPFRFDPVSGQVDQKQYADKQAEIRAIAKQYPGRADQIEQALTRSMDYAITQNQRNAQSVQLRDSQSGDAQSREIAKRAREAYLEPDPTIKAQKLHDLEQQSLAVLNNTRLSDSTAMRVSSAAVSAGAVARSSLEESNTKRLQGLTAIIDEKDPTRASPAAKERAYSELLTINSDPAITRDLTAGQRAYAQSGIDKVTMARLGADWAGMVMQAPKGEVSPSVFDAELQKGVKAGIYGDHVGATANMAQITQLSSINRAAFDKKAASERLAQDGLIATANGRPLTDAQKDAIKERQAFKLPGEAVGPDASNPGGPPVALGPQSVNYADPKHTQAVVDYVRQTGVMPERAKQAAEAMPRRPNEADMEPYKALYGNMYAVLAEKQTKMTGRPPDDDTIKRELGEMLGTKTANYLSVLSKFGAEAAYKLDLAQATKTSVTGQTGQPASGANQTIDGAADTFAKNAGATASSATWLAKLSDFRLPGTESWKNSQAERAAEKAFTVSPDVSPGWFGRITGAGPTVPAGGIKFTEEAKSFITGVAGAYLATDGQSIEATLTSGTKEDAAIAQMMERYGSMMEVTVSPDGKTGQIGFKSFAKFAGEAMGTDKLKPEVAQGFLHQLVQADRSASGITGADYDVKSVTAVPYLTPNNEQRFFVAAREQRTGMPVQLMDLAQNDPRLSAATMSADRAAWVAMGRNMVDKDGNPVDAGSVAYYGSAFARALNVPFEGGARAYEIGTAVTIGTAEFRTELDKRLRELSAKSGAPVAPDWDATMRNIARDPTADDGRHGLIRQIARGWTTPPEASIPAKDKVERISPSEPPPSQPRNSGPEAAAEAAARAAAEAEANKRGR